MGEFFKTSPVFSRSISMYIIQFESIYVRNILKSKYFLVNEILNYYLNIYLKFTSKSKIFLQNLHSKYR